MRICSVWPSHQNQSQSQSQSQSQTQAASLPSRTTSPARLISSRFGSSGNGSCGGSMPNGVGGYIGISLHSSSQHTQTSAQSLPNASCKCLLTAIPEATIEPPPPPLTVIPVAAATTTTTTTTIHAQKLLEFSLSSVGRSFIDEGPNNGAMGQQVSLTTPETPTPNISPSSQAFSNDFVPRPQATCIASNNSHSNIPLAEFGGSWDLLELDLQLNEVNLDPCYDTDVEECIFMGDDDGRQTADDNGDEDSDDDSVVVDDPFGMLPTKPTPPDSLDL
ncbi:uncharacterized protein Dwil_GK28278 [Drosophila willistoni]|uniref:Uncharacterized protein n=1 Tax=Drosophila willistoni TaxID=7260 RepID=A0A0Q9X214_DROWI|nr:uncharacterized protein Dwil_GK28278 [Drosophila willistoni]